MAEVSPSSTITAPKIDDGFLATLTKLQELLKTKDDTARFVGLALLKSILDNGQLVDQPDQVRVLWHSLSPKFLNRLLRAQQNDKVDEAEAKNMVDLAVAILHTFTVILQEDSWKDERFTEHVESLLGAIPRSTPETTTLILQTLLTIVSQPEGALKMLSTRNWTSMIEIASENPLVLDIFLFTWSNATTISQSILTVQTRIDETLSALIVRFQRTDAVALISLVQKLISQLPPHVLPQSPIWLEPLVSVLRNLVIHRSNAASRAAYTQLAALLLQIYSAMAPPLLFGRQSEPHIDDKPFSYLFVNLILIDLRASIPSVLSQINSSEYPTLSQRLVAAFDIISSFIGFLIKSLDSESIKYSLGMPPNLLLKLRKDVAETMSLTIEYLRDRWDASVAGVSGLDTTARSGAATTSEGARLTLTWDSKIDKISSDALILAGIRTLAIWIREDENENLRNEAAGLMDLFIELYKMRSADAFGFRHPILLALESVLLTEDAVEAFLRQGGWQVLFDDLESILRVVQDSSAQASPDVFNKTSRGIEIVRILLAVVDHPATGFPPEGWMSAVKTTTSIRPSPEISDTSYLELQIAAVQLSTSLLSKSALGVQKRYIDSTVALSGLAHQLDTIAGELDDQSEAGELSSLLQDVFLDLENLRSNLV